MALRDLTPTELQILQAIRQNEETIKSLRQANAALRSILPQQKSNGSGPLLVEVGGKTYDFHKASHTKTWRQRQGRAKCSGK